MVIRHMVNIGKIEPVEKWFPHSLSDVQSFKLMEIILRYYPGTNKIASCEKWFVYDTRKRSGESLDKEKRAKHIPKPSLRPKGIIVTIEWTNTGLYTSFENPKLLFLH